MPAIPDLFAKLRAENRKSLMPLVTSGYRDLAFTNEAFKKVVCLSSRGDKDAMEIARLKGVSYG